MFIEETEEPVVETTENEEETTSEEIVEDESETSEQISEKIYTEDDFNTKVNEKVDELLAKKIARKERKIRREYDNKYGSLVNVLKAGTGEDDIDNITDSFSQFYKRKGIEVPSMNFNDDDLKRLGEDDAEEFIEDGYEAIKEEVDRLAQIENKNPRELASFMKLAGERIKLEEQKELAKIGIGRSELEAAEFQAYNSKLNPELPLSERYQMYLDSKPQKATGNMGSMQSGNVSKIKDYYTPAEIERLTDEDLDDPRVWEAVRKSMTGEA